MTKVACYIDGFNLYHAIDALGDQRLKWLNLRLLAETLLRSSGETLETVVYFTSIMTWDEQKQRRHKEYLSALKASGVECIVSKFQKTNKHCQRAQRYCHFQEEKQTDVALAVRILTDCLTRGINRIIIITADSDQVPTVAAIRGLKPEISILIACPPGRKNIAKELGHTAHESREILEGRISQCLFPRNVKNADGKVVAKSPAKYQPSRLD